MNPDARAHRVRFTWPMHVHLTPTIHVPNTFGSLVLRTCQFKILKCTRNARAYLSPKNARANCTVFAWPMHVPIASSAIGICKGRAGLRACQLQLLRWLMHEANALDSQDYARAFDLHFETIPSNGILIGCLISWTLMLFSTTRRNYLNVLRWIFSF